MITLNTQAIRFSKNAGLPLDTFEQKELQQLDTDGDKVISLEEAKAAVQRANADQQGDVNKDRFVISRQEAADFRKLLGQSMMAPVPGQNLAAAKNLSRQNYLGGLSQRLGEKSVKLSDLQMQAKRDAWSANAKSQKAKGDSFQGKTAAQHDAEFQKNMQRSEQLGKAKGTTDARKAAIDEQKRRESGKLGGEYGFMDSGLKRAELQALRRNGEGTLTLPNGDEIKLKGEFQALQMSADGQLKIALTSGKELMVKCSAGAELNLFKAGVEFSHSTREFSVGEQQYRLSTSGSLRGDFGAKGRASLDLTMSGVKGQLGGVAGLQGGVAGKAQVQWKDGHVWKDLVDYQAGLDVVVGAGLHGEFKATLENKRLTLSGKLTAALGIGAGTDHQITFHGDNIHTWIDTLVDAEFTRQREHLERDYKILFNPDAIGKNMKGASRALKQLGDEYQKTVDPIERKAILKALKPALANYEQVCLKDWEGGIGGFFARIFAGDEMAEIEQRIDSYEGFIAREEGKLDGQIEALLNAGRK